MPAIPPPVRARAAGREDLDTVAELIARAFGADPVWGWAFADPARRSQQQRAVWRFLIESALAYEWVRVTEGCTAAAVWIPPGERELRPQDEQRFEPMLVELLGAGAPRVIDTCERFGRARPDRPHYYLSLLATHSEHRGRGIGMGLLANSLALIDAEGAAAYLESTNPANHRRYEDLGFARLAQFELAEDGPPVTQMWRDPPGAG